MDGVVAGFTDREGLASPFRHELRPSGLRLSWLREGCEVADLVGLGGARLLA